MNVELPVEVTELPYVPLRKLQWNGITNQTVFSDQQNKLSQYWQQKAASLLPPTE